MGDLIGVLRLSTLAEIAGVQETRALHQWASGERAPRGQRGTHLRLAYQLSQMVGTGGNPHAVRNWFEMPVPGLDTSPRIALATLPTEESNRAAVVRNLVSAASYFRTVTD